MRRTRDIPFDLPRLFISLLAVVAAVVPAFATDVQFTLSPRETWVGSPSVLKIIVRDGDTIGDPVFTPTAGLDFEIQPGRQTMSSMQIINGQITRNNTTAISVMITPSAVGVFEVAPVTIVVNGVKYSSAPMSISSLVSTAGDLLTAQVVGTSKEVWIGQVLHLTLRIAVKPFQSAEHRVTLGEADMWQFIDHERSDFGPFTPGLKELAQRGQRPSGREELSDGHAFFIYEISAQIIPASSGVPDFSAVRVALNYPTSLASSRGFFGRNELSVSATKPISAAATVADLTVLPLPIEGQPESFVGAVGSFAISSSAKPLQAAVGDPITLTVTVTDLAATPALDSLQPPLLDTAAMRADFRLPTAPLAGVVTGKTKTFTQTLRPTHAGVDEIPAIEFAWFDPTVSAYRRASTKPIAIAVSASEHIATDAIISKSSAHGAEPASLTATTEGFVANASLNLAMMDDHESNSVGSIIAVMAFAIPPAACATILLLRRRNVRNRGDVALTRARGARAAAAKKLSQGDPASALTGYIADRLNRPMGTVTRSEARRALMTVGATVDLQTLVDGVLGELERAQFGSALESAGGSSPAARHSDDARACLKEFEGLDWSKRS